MLAAPLAALLALACARAEVHEDDTAYRMFFQNRRSTRALAGVGTGSDVAGCLYEGRWFVPGARVAVRDACLRCACARGALACARAACAPPPDPPPPRCHLRHRRGACCPELYCPEGVTVLEHGGAARLEDEDFGDIATPASSAQACVEGGAVYAAGSAMGARAACEACFCLAGVRRCVRPRCLPAPRGCQARPAPGACCPARYYCQRPRDGDATTTPAPQHLHPHDCKVNGSWVREGTRAPAAEAGAGAGGSCTQCFCLRGAVRCQPLACAPPLHGCAPVLRAGHCCAHQYHCPHRQESMAQLYQPISDNALVATRNDVRSFRTTKLITHETTTSVGTHGLPASPATRNQAVSTTKVKRKTNDHPHSTVPTNKPVEHISKTAALGTEKLTTAAAVVVSTEASESGVKEMNRTDATDQPEGSVKIMINGTINCTAELSSTSLPLNITASDMEKILLEAQPRFPYIGEKIIEAHTSNPNNDIITDRNVNGNFDENETFTINVTSSLRTNTSHSTAAPSLTTIADVADTVNISKKTKGDYDYDYTEPTLPPSLPNLKIIPFVAADAVVDEDTTPKVSVPYPISDREDKFPVYYPTVESKETQFANRREDVYHSTQYPIFITDKEDTGRYPVPTHAAHRPSAAYPSITNDISKSSHEETHTTSQHSNDPGANKAVTKPESTRFTFKLQTPAVNLFSPPVETEGGFIPKGPGIIDEYYAVYPSTHVPASLPHLTTSMPLDTVKAECVTGDGRRVREGDSISVACSECACAWGGRLRCAPRACSTPRGCARRRASSSAGDLCCGELVCGQDNRTTPSPTLTTEEVEITLNDMIVPLEIQSEILPFDPPPDRRVPEPVPATTNISEYNSHSKVYGKNESKIDITPVTSAAVENYTTPTNNDIRKETFTASTAIPKTTEMTTTTVSTTTIAPTTAVLEDHVDVNDTKSQSQEYEDEEEDEGFSFGSVLKLLLSDSYDTTTISPYKKKPFTSTTKRSFTTTTNTPTTKPTTRKVFVPSTVAPFVPLPHHSYTPPKKVPPQNTVNRIDHLVLGEATAIKKSTPRPSSTTFRPMYSSLRPFPTRTSTVKTSTTTRVAVTKKEEPSVQYTPAAHEGPRPLATGGGGGGVLPGMGGLLKLAGCNIYGRMYRVGRIIAELSTECQECRCTELGVQCRPLDC